MYFRLAVPDRFRSILRVPELTQSLHTQNRKDAIPSAYKLASEAKTLFNHIIDSLMISKEFTGDELLSEIVQQLDVEDWTASAKLSTRVQGRKKEIELIKLKSKADAFDKIDSLTIAAAPMVQQEPITTKVVGK